MTDADLYLARLTAHLPAAWITGQHFLVWEERVRASGRTGRVPVASSSLGGWSAVSASDDRHWLPWPHAARQLQRHPPGLPAGLALVLSGSGLVAADLDASPDDAGAGPDLPASVLAVLHALGWPAHGYLERRPGGTGLHLIASGTLGSGPRRHAGTALLDAGLVPLSGDPLGPSSHTSSHPGFPDGALAALQDRWATLTAPHATRPAPTSTPDRTPEGHDDRQLLNRARRGRHGARFRRLYDFGDTVSDYPSRDEGVADLLALLLSLCGGDTARTTRLYRQCPLYRPELDDHPTRPDGRTPLDAALTRLVTRGQRP